VRFGRSVADPPDDPVVVEAAGEVAERLAEFLDGPESVQSELRFLQGPDQSLDAAIALGLPYEGRACFAAEGFLFRGFFMVSCVVPWSPRPVSRETVPRTRVPLARMACHCVPPCALSASLCYAAANKGGLSPHGDQSQEIMDGRGSRSRVVRSASDPLPMARTDQPPSATSRAPKGPNDAANRRAC
jgi:hypothetical protein